VIDMEQIVQHHSSGHVKRAIDVAVSVLLLVLSAPVMLAAAAYIYLSMGRPLLFRQQRTGIRGDLFTMLKFRTMREGADLPDAARLTPAGALLRSLSIDELPQLWNVLRGEMSLVGPRPLLPEYLPRYSQSQRRRLEVQPGITGWAQVSGRNAISWDEKFRLDVWYVDHLSNRLDLEILCKTAGKVLSRDGISEMGQVTVTRFCGSAFDGGELQ
jgi:sugar transferase EpsL